MVFCFDKMKGNKILRIFKKKKKNQTLEPNEFCEPLERTSINDKTLDLNPCGLIANSMFNGKSGMTGRGSNVPYVSARVEVCRGVSRYAVTVLSRMWRTLTLCDEESRGRRMEVVRWALRQDHVPW